MSGDRLGIEGKIADTFNEIVAANQRMAQQLERVGQRVGKEGKTKQRVRFGLSSGAWGEMESSVNTLIDDLLWPTTEVTRAIAAVAQGDLLETVRLDVEGRPLQGEFLQLGHHRQHDDQAARRVHLGSDARRARGRHRRQARRPGPGAGSDRRLEGPDRKRELDGVEPDRPGAQSRRGDDRRGERRPVEEDHRRRARRNPPAQGSHQHDGGPAPIVRVGSDARGARGRHRRQARRSGDRARRRRHLEGPHRQRQPAGGQPDHAGPQHRAGDDRRGARRPVAQDHRGREGRSSGAEGHHQHHGGPAQRLRLGSDARRARGRHRRQARRPGRRCRASPAPGRT